MSQVIFNSYIDLENLGATPSGVGYTVGYDLDGVLKQKDQDGVITPISSSSDLEGVLTNGNYSGTYSIRMGTASSIFTINGRGKIALDRGNTSSVSISATASFPNTNVKFYSPTYSHPTVNWIIPDGSGTYILATISVPDGYSPSNLFARVDIRHTWVSDLILNLVSPGGGVISLFSGTNGSADNLTNTIFTSDTSFPSITSGSSPFTSTFRWNATTNNGDIPYRSNKTDLTGLLNGSSTNGNWILYMDDTAGSDIGSFSKWDLWFEYNPTDVVGTEEIVSLSGFSVESKRATNVSTMELSTSTFSAYVGTSTYSSFIENTPTKLSMGHYDFNAGVDGKISVFESGRTYDALGSRNKAYAHINTYGSTTSYGVSNTVVIGGQYINATRSNYVYLGNWVNINNKYTLPNDDGLANQVMVTNGSGTASWATFSLTNPPLSAVLAVGNMSGTNNIQFNNNYGLILGTGGSNISNAGSTSLISLNYNAIGNIFISPNGIDATQSYINAGTTSMVVQSPSIEINTATGSITTTDGQGLKYTQDYNTGFVTYSLVTKGYVDTYGGGYNTHLIAYVDPNKGSDVTGEVGKPYRPYQSIGAAMIGVTGSAYSTLNRGLIHLRKGNYTAVARLVSNVDYFCDQGVVFTQNGFRDFSAVTANVYGNASFIGTDSSLVPLTIQYGSSVIFQFDTVNNNTSFGRIYGPLSVVKINGNNILTKSDSGYGISLESSSTVSIDVRQGIVAAYNTLRFQNFTGTADVKTPFIYCNADVGSLGYSVPSSINAIKGSTLASKVTIEGNIEDVSSLYGGALQSAVYVSAGDVSIRGNIKSTSANAITVVGSSVGTLSVNGDVIANREAIVNLHSGAFQMKIKNSLIKSNGLGSATQSVYMTGPGYMYIDNSTIYNGLTDSCFINVTDDMSTIGIYNSMAYSPGSYGTFMYCTYSEYTIGYHNVRSNKDNEDNITDLFEPSGFIYDPYLFVPNF